MGPNCPFQSFEQYALNVPTRFPSLKLHYVQCTYYVLYVVVAVPMLVISFKTFLIAGNVFAIHKQHIPHLNANFGGNKLSPIPLVSSTHIASEEVL